MNSGAGLCSYLMIGERNANDLCVYPDSNKIAVNALRTKDSIFEMSGVRRWRSRWVKAARELRLVPVDDVNSVVLGKP